MNTFLRHDFTGTSGVGDGSMVRIFEPSYFIPQDIDGIRSIHDFKEKYKNNDGRLNHNYINIQSFLNNLSDYLTSIYSNKVCPITYLYHLYYEDQLSTIDIFHRLGHLGNYTSNDRIEKIFKRIFGWDLRGNNEKTILRKKKFKAKIKPYNLKAAKEKQSKIQLVEEILKREQNEKKDFNKMVYLSLKNIAEKAKYILDSQGYIPAYNFTNMIGELKNQHGVKVTAGAIENILNHALEKQTEIDNINFHPARIREIVSSKHD